MSDTTCARIKAGPAPTMIAVAHLLAGFVVFASVPEMAYAGITVMGFGIIWFLLALRPQIVVCPRHIEINRGLLAPQIIPFAALAGFRKEGRRYVLERKHGETPVTIDTGKLRALDIPALDAGLEQGLAHASDDTGNAAPAESPAVGVMNRAVVVSLIVNTLLVLIVVNDPALSRLDPLPALMGGFLLVAVAGLVMMARGGLRAGSILANIGFFAFVPIGAIGVVGVSRYVAAVRRRQMLSGTA